MSWRGSPSDSPRWRKSKASTAKPAWLNQRSYWSSIMAWVAPPPWISSTTGCGAAACGKVSQAAQRSPPDGNIKRVVVIAVSFQYSVRYYAIYYVHRTLSRRRNGTQGQVHTRAAPGGRAGAGRRAGSGCAFHADPGRRPRHRADDALQLRQGPRRTRRAGGRGRTGRGQIGKAARKLAGRCAGRRRGDMAHRAA